MNYSAPAFSALHREIDRQGGAMLPDLCSPQDVTYSTKGGYVRNETQKGVTCGCGNLSRFVLPYEAEPNKPLSQGKPSFVTFCAVCDSGGAWPRTCEAVYAADPDMDIMLDEHEDLEEDDDGS